MELKEIGRFNLGAGMGEYHRDYVFIILESKEKDGYYHYWLNMEGYGLIIGIIGTKERDTAQGIWDYLCMGGLGYYFDEFNGIQHEEEED